MTLNRTKYSGGWQAREGTLSGAEEGVSLRSHTVTACISTYSFLLSLYSHLSLSLSLSLLGFTPAALLHRRPSPPRVRSLCSHVTSTFTTTLQQQAGRLTHRSNARCRLLQFIVVEMAGEQSPVLVVGWSMKDIAEPARATYRTCNASSIVPHQILLSTKYSSVSRLTVLFLRAGL